MRVNLLLLLSLLWLGTPDLPYRNKGSESKSFNEVKETQLVSQGVHERWTFQTYHKMIEKVKAMTNQIRSVSSKIDQLLKAVANNPTLERQLRLAITAQQVCNVASSAEIEISPGDLVKHYAGLLVSAPDDVAVANFDLCSWDSGELLWAMRQWK